MPLSRIEAGKLERAFFDLLDQNHIEQVYQEFIARVGRTRLQCAV